MRKRKKDKAIAYAIGFFTGFIGGHKFYLDKNKQGVMHLLPYVLIFLSCYQGLEILATLALFSIFVWWVIDMIKLGREVDEVNGENEIDSEPEPPKPMHQPAINSNVQGFANTPGDSLDQQLIRAKSLLQLNIVNPNEFGLLNTNIASGQFVLSQNVYHDVVNLNSMKERQAIDEFMYDMQRAQILGFKYLEK